LFEPYGLREIETRHYQSGDRNYKWKNFEGSHAKNRMLEEKTPQHLSKDTKFNIPPYLPDTDLVRRDMWKLYNNIAEMDRQVGAVLKQLEEDGLLENTIIFFYGDHGGPLPRQKRLIYDSGLNTPMIVRFPNKWKAGTTDDQLVSFIDFAPTLLSLTGSNPPEYFQGQAFEGYFKADERQYIHAAADRFDGYTDAIRAVRDERFKYIRNYRPEQGYYLPIDYREQIPTMQELLRLRDVGELDGIQMQWFRKTKEAEELFDCVNDPHELHNLANDPKYAAKLKELQTEMDRWIAEINDQPNLPEKELLNQLWNGAETQPVTANPVPIKKDKLISINCATEGASIGYKLINDGKIPESWSIYTDSFQLEEASQIQVKAHRIGFKPSETVTLDF
jgi:arylsulfatase A-like enzyme